MKREHWTPPAGTRLQLLTAVSIRDHQAGVLRGIAPVSDVRGSFDCFDLGQTLGCTQVGPPWYIKAVAASLRHGGYVRPPDYLRTKIINV